MKKYAAFAASVVIGSVALVGCGEDDFCGEAEDIAGTSEIPDAATVQELADKAPDEIADDLQVLADAMDNPQSADQGAVQEASSNLEAWGEDNCDT